MRILYRTLLTGLVAALLVPATIFAAGQQGDGELSFESDIDWEEELGDYEGETINIIMIADPWVDQFNAVAPDFEALTGAEVVIDSYGYDQTYEQQVLEGSQESDSYDIFVMDSPWVGEFWEAGYVNDLTSFIEQDEELVNYEDFVEVHRDVANYDGNITGIPFGAYFKPFIYRADLFEEEGFDPPETYDDVREIAATFTDNEDYPNMNGIALNNAQGAPVGQAWFEYIYNFGGRPFESLYPGTDDPYADMTPRFDSEESIALVEFFIEMLEYQPTGALDMQWDERAQLFLSGNAAMTHMWSVRMPAVVDPDRSVVADSYGVTTVPSLEGVDTVSPVGGWVMSMNSQVENEELAWDFIKWFTSEDVHRAFVEAGGPPSRYSALEDPELQEMYPWFDTILEIEDISFADNRPRIPESAEIIDIVGLQVSEALSGNMSAEEAMQEANEEIRELMEEAGYPMSE